MDRSTLNELSYKAQLGEPVEIDQFDLRELINNTAKIGELENRIEAAVWDIESESKDIEQAADKIKTLVFIARAQIQANKDDFDDCFTVIFNDVLEQIEQKAKEIQSSNSAIEGYCGDAKDAVNSDII